MSDEFPVGIALTIAVEPEGRPAFFTAHLIKPAVLTNQGKRGMDKIEFSMTYRAPVRLLYFYFTE